MPDDAKLYGGGNIRYGRQSFDYEVRPHVAARLKIEVYPDLRVVAYVPAGKSAAEVRERVRRRSRWILRQINEFSKYHPLPVPKQYRSGESVFYLGRQYRLKVMSGDVASVKLRGGRLVVQVPDRSQRSRIEALVADWYQLKAEDYFLARAEVVRPRLAFLGNQPIRLRVRPMETRWGSCSPSGLITLNPDLVKAPSPCIDYVLIHELCHLEFRDHSPSFYRLLGSSLPDWKNRRGRLNTFGVHA